MADFNPQVPIGTPQDYTNVARAIDAPPANVSKEIALKTVGEGLSGFAKIADQFITNKAKEETYEGASAIRDITTQTLQTATQPQNTVPQPTTTGKGPSLLDSNAQMDPPPQPVQDGLARAATIGAARDASSGRNDTLYTTQLNALAVKLRSQYPGYRGVIDETMQSVTGMNPANAQLNSMLEDLKASKTAQEKMGIDVLNDVRGLKGKTVDGIASDTMTNFVMNNIHNPQALAIANKWVYGASRLQSETADKTAAFTAKTQDDTDLKASAKTAFQGQMSAMSQNHFSAHAAANGTDGVSDATLIQDSIAHPEQYTTDQVNAATQRMAANQLALTSQMKFTASQFIHVDPNNPNSPYALDSNKQRYSYKSLLGADADSIIQGEADNYGRIIKAVADKDTGPALYASRYAKGVRDDLDANIVRDPLNKSLLIAKWQGDNMPKGLAEAVLTESMVKGVQGKLANQYLDKTMESIVPPNAIGNQSLPSFKKNIDDAKNKVNTGVATDQERQALAQGLVNNLRLLTNQPVGPKKVMLDDATQMRLAEHYFGPQNRGVLQDWNQGFYKDASGQPVKDSVWNTMTPGLTYVPGREAAWDQYTNPAITKNMARLGALPGGQDIVRHYVEAAEAEHGQMAVGLIKTLNDLQDQATKGVGTDLKKGPVVHLKYNADSGEFSFIDKNENVIRPDPNRPSDLTGLKTVVERGQPILDKLNGIGKNMMNIQDNLGNKQGMSAYYLDLLNKEGFKPNENMRGMPQQFYDAISASHKLNRIEDTFKDAGPK